jgi:hypothetical protein
LALLGNKIEEVRSQNSEEGFADSSGVSIKLPERSDFHFLLASDDWLLDSRIK